MPNTITEPVFVVYGRTCALATADFPTGRFPRSVAMMFGAIYRSISDAADVLDHGERRFGRCA